MKKNFTSFYCIASVVATVILHLPVQSQIISTVAGGGSGSGVQATQAALPYPTDVTFDAAGNKYVVCNGDGTVRRISTAGIITTVVGGGTGTLNNGGLATNGPLLNPTSVAVDALGNLYITEWGGVPASRIRKVNTSGIITTIAGTGVSGYNGDNIVATSAQLNFPTGITLDGSGNVYFADFLNNRVRKINSAGIISTVVGNGIAGYNGDGITAVAAQLNLPSDLAINDFGNIYIADNGNQRVRVLLTNGVLFNVAGTGTAGFSGDGGSAINAQLNSPWGLSIDASPNDLYVSCQGDSRIRKVTGGGIISTAAGNGVAAYSGDGNMAPLAQLNGPWGMVVSAGSLFIADENNHRLRQVNSSRIISTTAGNGASNVNGDGGPALNALISDPYGVSIDRGGNIYFSDKHRVRKVTPSGVITTIAGNGVAGSSGDGSQATTAQLNFPYGVYADPYGNIYIGTTGDNRIRKINSAGVISTFAGNGVSGYTGDGGLATNASIVVQNLTGDFAGNIYFTDYVRGVVRKINGAGIISTIAGTGVQGYSGDGGPATSAQLKTPGGISVDAAGNLYVVDNNPNVVRKINTSGIISTVAGGSSLAGNSGDGGPATAALFSLISNVSADPLGNLYIVDAFNHRARKVNVTTGVISAFAGTGTSGFAGDGGSAVAAQFNTPWSIAQDTAGNIYTVDRSNFRIRKITLPYTLSATNITINQTLNGAFSTDINDNNYHRLLTITPTQSANMLSGNVAFQLSFDGTVQTYNGKPYVPKHYDITPVTNASTAQATVKLYFLQSDFDAYNSYVTTSGSGLPLLPTGGSDNGNIKITQFHGTGTTPGNYTGGSVLITPTVFWNTTNNWWELTFPVTGFSGFYVTTGNIPLPLTLLFFTASLQSNNVILNWKTNNEQKTSYFDVERSADGQRFIKVGTVTTISQSGIQTYTLSDAQPLEGKSFYRLKQVDRDGKFEYSKTVVINRSKGVDIQVFPNPAGKTITLLMPVQNAAQTVTIFNTNAQTIKQVTVPAGVSTIELSVEGLTAGQYFIKWQSGEEVIIKPFIKL